MTDSAPIIPWAGGKRRLAEQIIPLIPHHKCYVEPFAGGGAIYFLKEPSEVEVLNDINGDLINLYRIVKHHFEEFYRQFKYTLSARQTFQWHQQTDPKTLTDIQRAARFFYLQKHAYSGKVHSQSFGTATTTKPRFNLLRIEEELSNAHIRLQDTWIEHLSWDNVMDKYDREHTVFFIDPPYWQTEGYGVDFNWDQYLKLYDYFNKIKGKAILTLNAHPDILTLFKDFPQHTVDIKYSLGNAPKASQEVIIRNADFRSAPTLFDQTRS